MRTASFKIDLCGKGIEFYQNEKESLSIVAESYTGDETGSSDICFEFDLTKNEINVLKHFLDTMF